MTIQDAMKVLISELKSDQDYRYSWQANIAMAVYDAYTDSGRPRDEAIHAICNQGAIRFLDLLCRDREGK